MKSLKIVLFLFITNFVTTQTAFSQEINHIEVTGKAEKEIVPNEIHIEICINERMEKGEKVTIEQQETSLKKELTSLGVPLDNLSISDLNANIAKIGWWREKVLASANYDLKVNDASKLKDVFNVFEKLKITEAHITKATHSKLQELKKQNRIAAIKAAKEKADYLLNAIGQKTGKPIKVHEIPSNHHQDFATANYVGNSSYESRKIISNISKVSAGNVQFKKIKLTSSIYVKFKIQ